MPFFRWSALFCQLIDARRIDGLAWVRVGVRVRVGLGLRSCDLYNKRNGKHVKQPKTLHNKVQCFLHCVWMFGSARAARRPHTARIACSSSHLVWDTCTAPAARAASCGWRCHRLLFQQFSLNAIQNWKPVFGHNLLGISIGRGFGALKGLKS